MLSAKIQKYGFKEDHEEIDSWGDSFFTLPVKVAVSVRCVHFKTIKVLLFFLFFLQMFDKLILEIIEKKNLLVY